MYPFRVHGDNIVECERLIQLALRNAEVLSEKWTLYSLACPAYIVKIRFNKRTYECAFELFPGFNKNTKKRWNSDIFDILHENGSYLDETPDAILTALLPNGQEKVLVAIEFCSALQAGNQAWQRSGRAFSTGRTGCPYLYLVDFVKYELDSEDRERKALRFPNPAVPYSYINYSKNNETLVVQAYVRSEEFQKNEDPSLAGFDESWFAEEDISNFLLCKMFGLDTKLIEKKLFDKNYNVVEFLSKDSRGDKFDSSDWHAVYSGELDLLNYNIRQKKLKFYKKIAEKSSTGKTAKFNNLVKTLAIGFTSMDLPFGIIPAENRAKFVEGVLKIYPGFKVDNLKGDSDLIICLIKGFKPRGDDNRPDRGILPFAAMLADPNIDILTYIYGPLIQGNLDLLQSNPYLLSVKNGLWRSILSLSNYLIIDSPVIGGKPVELFINNTQLKQKYNPAISRGELVIGSISDTPINFREDDVDTILHMFFKHVLTGNTFECMCNPPGGDWSGISICQKGVEYRWLSLPRVSDSKRPDHVIELFNVFSKPALLLIESKEIEESLHYEKDVGNSLKEYITWLMNFVPSVERVNTSWKFSHTQLSKDDFIIISAVAYISQKDSVPTNVFNECKCDLVFTLYPVNNTRWDMRIFSNSPKGESLRVWILNLFNKLEVDFIRLRQ